MKKNAIRLPLESLIYLNRVERKQRIGNELSKKSIELITKNYNYYAKNGGKIVMDDDFGGAIGNPENSYEEGRWTNWKVEDMKKMLDEAKLPYEEVEGLERINIII